jgi:hypothetical protein
MQEWEHEHPGVALAVDETQPQTRSTLASRSQMGISGIGEWLPVIAF